MLEKINLHGGEIKFECHLLQQKNTIKQVLGRKSLYCLELEMMALDEEKKLKMVH